MTSTDPDAAWSPPRRSVVAWVLYDLANTIFALGVAGLYFPAWVTNSGWPDAALSVTIAAAMVVVIVLSPWIGARADHYGRRLDYLVPTTLAAVGATAVLGLGGVGPSLVAFAVALIAFNLGSVVYDALLPEVSTVEDRGRVSGIGVGVGYLGSFVAVGIGEVLLDDVGYLGVFRAIAVAFLVFALPAFLLIQERPRRPEPGPPPALRDGTRRLVAAWRRARTYEGVTRFLVGRFLYADAINTLIGGFLTIFVIQELGFTDAQVRNLLALAIAAAIVGGLVAGRLVDRLGPRRVLHGALYGWMASMVVGIAAAVTDTTILAWLIGPVGGISLGATWTADRVYMATISPPRHLGEFYGLYATVGRFATILGPLVWAGIVNGLGLPRAAALAALLGFLLASRLLLAGVDDRARRWTPEDLPRLQDRSSS